MDRKKKSADQTVEKKRSEGQTVESYCGKCKIECAHTITEMDEDGIVKVRCTVCGGCHKPRSAPEAGEGRKSKAGIGPVDEATARSNWETCLASATGREYPYSMTAQYRVGDIVDHFAFGKGVVLKLYSRRCDMLFKDRSRLMVSANQ